MAGKFVRYVAGAIVLASIATLLFTDFDSEAQVMQRRVQPGVGSSTNMSLRQALVARPSLAQFKAIQAASHSRAELSRNLLAASIPAKVNRICFISGGYPASANCVTLRRLFNEEMRLGPADQQLMKLGLNDLWDAIGGDPTGGDLVACGGASAGSLTDFMPHSGGAGQLSASPQGMSGNAMGANGAMGPRPGQSAAVAGAMGSGDLTALTNDCRNHQISKLQQGVGAVSPQNAAYNGAVQSATGTMDAAMQGCHDSGNGMVADEPAGDDTGTPPKGKKPKPKEPLPPPPPSADNVPAPQQAMNLVSLLGSVTDLVFAGAIKCGSGAASCVAGVVLTVAGMTATTVAAAGGTGDVAVDDAVSAAGDATSVVSGGAALLDAVGAGATAAGAEMILPAFAALGVGTAIGNVLMSNNIGSMAQGGDLLGQLYSNYKADQMNAGGGAHRPAPEGGKPTCAAMQAKWSHFKAYCSQAGNNWRSYDCVKFVSKMNGCADPGLIQSGPEDEYTCQARCHGGGSDSGDSSGGPFDSGGSAASCQQQQAAALCAQREKMRGLIANPGGPGGQSQCRSMAASALEFQNRLQTQICQRAGAGGGDKCGMSMRTMQPMQQLRQ